MKKSSRPLSLQLTLNPDILASVSALQNRPFCVGFAAETENLEKYALNKLERKNLDMIAANQVGGNHSGFEIDFNELIVFWRNGQEKIEFASKSRIADQLIELIWKQYTATR